MVCLGNICRSPLAEGIMKAKAKTNGLEWEVDSAGTGSWHVGNLPDSRSISKGLEYGIDIRDQRARQLKSSDLENYDLLLAMDTSNYNNILKLATSEEQKQKVRMIMNFVQPGWNQSVPDPYYDNDGFEQVYQMLDKACEKIILEYK